MDTDRIAFEAAQIQPGRAVGRGILTTVAAVFYAVGWTAGFISVSVSWSIAAAKVGWRDARQPHARLTERQRGAA